MYRVLFLCCWLMIALSAKVMLAQEALPVEVVSATVPGEVIVAADGSYPTGVVQNVSYQSTVINDVLAVVNQKRRRAGLYAFQFDPMLSDVAHRKSMNRASRRLTGHDGLPKGGAAVEGVGYAHGYSNLLGQFNTCYLYSRGYRSAGAAVAYDGSGRAYYTLLLR